MATYKKRLYGTRLDRAIEELDNSVYVVEENGKKVNDTRNLSYPKNRINNYLNEGYKATKTTTKKKKKDDDLLDKIGYTLKELGAGGLQGLTGLGTAVTTDLADNLRQGNEGKKSDVFGDLFLGLLSPATYLTKKTAESIKDNFGDKNKTTTQKIVGSILDAGSNSLEAFAPTENLIKGAGTFLPNTLDDKVMEFGEAIQAPSDRLRGKLDEEAAQYGTGWQTAGTVSNVVGNMLPSIAATVLTKNPQVGMATMGISAKGTSTTEALKRGADLEEAVKIGNTKAAVEVGAEMLTGGLNIFGKGALDDIVTRGIDKKVKNQVLNYLAQKGAGILGEVGEETITDILNTTIDKGTVDPNAKYSIDDFGETAVTTMLSTVVLNAITGGYGSSSFKANTERMQENGYSQNEETVINSLVSEHINSFTKQRAFENEIENAITAKEAEQGGILSEKEKKALREQISTKIENGEIDISSTKVSNAELEAIREIVEEQMQKGELDTNKIESILGNTITEQDSVLARSYEETARKRESFTYDDIKVTNEQEKAVYDSAAKYFNNTTRSHEFVEKVAKIAKDKGTKYGFINNEELKSLGHDIEGKQVNGLVRTNVDGEQTVLINIDSPKALNAIVGHETTHLLEGTQEYQDLQEAIFNYAKEKGDFNGRLDSLNSLYEGIENANIDAELTADLVGDYLFTDNEFINSLSTQKPTLFQKIKELIDDLVVRFTGTKEEKALREVQKKFKEAYRKSNVASKETNTQYALGNKNGIKTEEQQSKLALARKMREEGKTANEIWEKTRFQYNSKYKDFAYDIKDAKLNKNADIELEKSYKLGEILVDTEELFAAYPKLEEATLGFVDFEKKAIEDGKTGKALRKASVAKGVSTDSNEIYLNSKYDFTYGEIDGILAHEIQHLIQTYEDPPTENTAKLSGKEYRLHSQELEAEISKVRSKMTDEQKKYFKPSDVLNMIKEYYEKYDYQAIKVNTIIDMLESTRSNVKYSISDNQGRTLTKEQQEYFKDSKVRDSEGRLLEVYHGTNVDFNVFSYDNFGANGNRYGTGFYFTDDIKEAEHFTNNGTIKKEYLNIKKPLNAYGKKMSYSKFSKILNSLNEYGRNNIDNYNNEEIFGTNENAKKFGHQDNISKSIYDFYNNSNSNAELMEAMFIYSNKMGLDIPTSLNIFEKATGNDGMVGEMDNGKKVYVTFNSNQIKNIDNTNPTSDADIRYSLSEDSQGNELKPAVQKWAEKSKARDENGNLKVLYHGTATGEFTVFDKSKASPEGDWGAGFYLTDNETDVEANYEDGGADFENRIERYAHKLETEAMLDGEEISYEEALEKAREILYKGSYKVTAYVNMENPAIVGKTYLFSDYGDNYNIEDFETEEEYYEAIDQLVADDIDSAIWAIEREYDFYNGTDDIRNLLWEAYADGGMEIQSLKDRLGELYLETDEGLVGHDVARIIIESLGYDGIIDPTVSTKWNMSMDSGTTHYIAFKPNQIKNVTNENPTDNPDINMSLSNPNEDIAPTGDYNVYGEDVKLQQAITPLQEEIKQLTESISELKETIEMPRALTEADLPMIEKENQARLNSITDADAPTEIEEYLAITPEKEPKMKRVKENPTYNEIAEILTEEPKTESDRNKRKWAIFKANVLDKGMVFEDLALKENNRELIAKWDYTLTSEARGQYAIGKGHNGSKSLDAIRQEVDNTGLTKDFYNYMYHKHNVDRMTLASRFEGMENKPVFGDSVTADVSQRIVNQYESQHPEFMDFAQDVYDYVNADKQLLVDNGVISQETADLWSEMYPHYVPTRRTTDTGVDINVPLDTMKTGINSPIKKATGGSADILPLFDTMAMRTLQTYRATAKNSFGVELMNTMGTTIESAETNVDEVIDSIDAQDGLLQEGKKGKNPTFTVFDGGEKITFEITKDMYDALKPVSESSLLSKTIKPLNVAGNIRRGLLTEYNPTFMLTNAIKDTQDILLNSQHSLKTYAKIPEAHKQLLTKGYWYEEYIANGGEQNSYFDNETNTFNTKNKGLKKALDLPPLSTISKVNNYIEMIPRLAEYIASRESGASIEVAMLDAARVTTNFKAGGAVTKFANRNGATFLNASVQGAMQQVRNIREAKANGVRGWVNLAAKFTMAALPAVLLNNLVWEDDEEYEELSDYVKQNYYVVGKTDDGTFIRIPKGRAVAVIQEAVNQMENLITGDDEADLKSFIELTINNLAPNNPLDNNIFSPIAQVAQNKTWYGGDLVPTRLQDLPKAEQYDESTDEFSKWIGEIFNVSPYKVNYLLDQYSGGVGDVVLPMMTPEATSDAETVGEHLLAPFKSKFTTNSTMNNQNISDFYDSIEELATNAKKSDATDNDVLSNKYMNSVKAEMNELYKEKREIQNSDLSKKEKYEQVLDIQSQINELAENALSEYSNVSSASNYAKVSDREYYKRINSEGETEWTKIDDDLADDLENLGLTHSEKNTYFKTKDEINLIDDDSETKKAEIIEAIKGTGFSDKQKAYMYKKYYNTDTVDLVVSSGINIDAYFDYASKEFVADKDSSGKSISGSRKKKVIKYVNSLNLSIPEKAILIKSTNTFKFNDYNKQIVEYVSGLDISYDEKKAILEELDMKVYADGRVRWE